MSKAGPIDTAPVVATCNRCNAYVFACTVSGCKVACDIAPLDRDGYVAALVARKGTYNQVDQGGRPWRLQRRTAASTWPPWQGRKVLADHACGAQGQDSLQVTTIPPLKPGATSIVRPTVASGGASRLSRHCAVCKTEILPGEPYWGIEHGNTAWQRHDYECGQATGEGGV